MIRLSGAGRTFRHGGLELGPGWVPFETLTETQRETLRDRHGRYVRVHPDDRGKLAELGLEFKGPNEPLVEIKSTTPKPADAPKAEATPKKLQTTTTPKPADAPKAEAKKD